ncbi:MAG: AAA family ATPase [Deltaproteobacteria bacterium]|nr:AAA family ATPase [Deltaproteobacteria bacterium]
MFEDKFYTDKTPYIYKMVEESEYSCLFLSRPRSFGKSSFYWTS